MKKSSSLFKRKKQQWFVDDAKEAWSWMSVQIILFGALAEEIYQQLNIAREFVDPKTFHHAMAALLIVSILGRVAKQTRK